MRRAAPHDDPRRPDEAVPYKQTEEEVDDDALGDYAALLSLLCGMCGMMLKMKLLSWAALFLCFVAFSTMRWTESETKSIFASFSFSMMGLVMSYFGPNRPGAPLAMGNQ
eukprot:gnl/Trimastix_PCT/2841.p1 GENE.gnl/Trimastix_PCT/2841~~gnl/Trimastix_PCT/2841.p1  ORF type:complete len:122 (-),score=17.99 gnl/Trimastix_PCT/2841:32-361(-)